MIETILSENIFSFLLKAATMEASCLSKPEPQG